MQMDSNLNQGQTQQQEQESVSQLQNGIFEDYSDKKTGLSSKQKLINRTAMVCLALNLNNVITPGLYMAFVLIDAFFLIYIPCVILASQIRKVSLSNIWALEIFLQFPNENVMIIIQTMLLLIQIIFIIGMAIIVYTSNIKLGNLDKQRLIYKIYFFALILFDTIMPIPMLLMTFNSVFGYGQRLTTTTLQIVMIMISAINIVILTFLHLVFKKIYLLNLNYGGIPWATADSKHLAIRYLLKVILAFFHSFYLHFEQWHDMYLAIICTVILIVQTIYMISRVMYRPCYNLRIYFVTNILQEISQGMTVVIILGNYSQYDLQSGIFYSIAFSFCFIIFYNLIRYFYKDYILQKLSQGQLKRISEFQIALQFLQDISRDITEQQTQSKIQSASFILALIRKHNESCQDQLCFCQHTHSLLWILKRARENNQDNFISIYEDELDFLNKYNQGEFIMSKERIDAGFCVNDYLSREYVTLTENIQISESVSLEDTQQQKVENEFQQPLYKIDLNKLIQSYLSQYIKLTYEEAIQKFPNDKTLQLTQAYLALFIQRNTFICMNLLRCNKQQGFSTMNLMSYKVNELYLIYELKKIFKERATFENGYRNQMYGVINEEDQKSKESVIDLISQESLDADHFIQINLKTSSFYSSINSLGLELMELWRTVLKRELEIEKLVAQGNIVADRIRKIQKLFGGIDFMCKQRDHKVYHCYAMVHKQLLNDLQSYDLYMNKMKSLITMSKLFKTNNLKMYSDVDLGLLLVNAFDAEFGKILIANQSLLKILGYSQSEVKHAKIGVVQPTLVKDIHGKIMQEFKKSGAGPLLHKNVNLVVVLKNGYIAPAQVNVQFHFSLAYGYTFITYIQPIQELQLQPNGQKLPVGELMLFYTDEDGYIYEISETCQKILDFDNRFLNSNELNTQQGKININDIIPEINISKISKLQNDQSKQNNIFQMTFDLNLDIINHLKQGEISSIYRVRKTRALAVIFRETYAKGILKTNLIVVKTLNDYQIDSNKEHMTFKDPILEEAQQLQDLEKVNDELDSASASSNSHSSNEFDMVRNNLASYERQTPRSLKIILQLIILVFLIMIIVSSINMYLTQNRSNELSSELSVIQNAFYRNNINNRIRNLLRTLVNIANGYEPNNSELISDRFTAYKAQLGKLIDEFKYSQNIVENSGYDYSNNFAILVGENSVVEYLDEKNQIYTQSHTVEFTFKLYITRLIDFYNMNQTDLKGNLNIMTLNPKKGAYAPTLNERTIFFVIQNSVNIIWSNISKMRQFFIDDMADHAERSILSTQTTVIISICSIILVGIIVTPLLSRIEDRKYNGLSFFFLIQPLQIEESLVKCFQFLVQVSEILGTNANNTNQSNQLMEQIQGSALSLDDISFEYTKYNEKSISDQDNLVSMQYDLNTPHTNQRKIQQEIITKRNSLKRITQSNKNIPSQDDHNNSSVMNQVSEEYKESNITYQDKKSSMSINTVPDQNHNNEHKNEPNDQILNKEQLSKEHAEITLQKMRIISKTKVSKRIKIFVFCLLIIVVFSGYFIASYFMALRTFDQLQSTVETLRKFFQRGSCISNMGSWIRENSIRNTTVDPKKDKAADQFATCQQASSDYREIRKYTPPPYQFMMDSVNDIEDHGHACNYGFTQNDPFAQYCKTIYHGILNRGLQNTLELISSSFYDTHLRYIASNRTKDELLKFINDEEIRQFLEMHEFINSKILLVQRNNACESILKYYSTIMEQYQILFSCFICLLIGLLLTFFIYFYKKIREHMLKTNILLRVIPLDKLPIKKLQELKALFN